MLRDPACYFHKPKPFTLSVLTRLSYLPNVQHETTILGLLGLSQMAQGVMSFIYHTCPNPSTLATDAIFMNVLATLFLCLMYRILHHHHRGQQQATFWLCSCTAAILLAEALPQTTYSKVIVKEKKIFRA